MPQYKRLLAVSLFLALMFAVFELSGLHDHLNLASCSIGLQKTASTAS